MTANDLKALRLTNAELADAYFDNDGEKFPFVYGRAAERIVLEKIEKLIKALEEDAKWQTT